MVVVEEKPASELAPYIKNYSFIRADRPLKRERCLPDGCIKLFLFESSSRLSYFDGDGRGLAWGDGVGGHVLRTDLFVEISKPIRLTICSFWPAAFYALFRIPIGHFNNDVVPPEEMLGPQYVSLKNRLGDAVCCQEKKNVLDAFFGRLVRKLNPAEPTLIWHAQNKMLLSGGNILLRDLLADGNISVRSLERHFLSSVGMSPKYYCRVLRFNKAFQLKAGNPHVSWQEIVYACGYYDQAHYIDEFRHFTGLPPGAYYRDDRNIASAHVGTRPLSHFSNTSG